MRILAILGLLLAFSLVTHAQVGVTVLTFDLPGGVNGTPVPASYGDNVAGTASGGFNYQGGGAFTPDVTTSWTIFPSGTGLATWTTGYGDLQRVAIGSSNPDTLAQIVLTATPGKVVRLFGVDFGNFQFTAITIPSIIVRNAGGTIIDTQTNLVVPDRLSGHLHVSWPALTSSTLTIEIALPPTGLYDIGFDDLAFGQLPGGVSGQANSTTASLAVNGPSYPGVPGPGASFVPLGQALRLDWTGPANQALILLAGPLNVGSLLIPCVGNLDLGTGPTFGDVLVVFDGSQNVFPGPLFRLSPAGQATQTFTTWSPFSIAIQGLVYQGAGAPCFVKFTEATLLIVG